MTDDIELTDDERRALGKLTEEEEMRLAASEMSDHEFERWSRVQLAKAAAQRRGEAIAKALEPPESDPETDEVKEMSDREFEAYCREHGCPPEGGFHGTLADASWEARRDRRRARKAVRNA